MSDVIKLLPDSVANQIAAGEVIQRPSSVIKELVENAIDAHATQIQIILKDAGRTLIQVIDDGDGMSDTDARLAFERHSTSKISQASDLFALRTMGFRGEALASIAAISQVELRTRKNDAQLGTKLIINASHCESQEPTMCPKGSNFMIKNIFFNVPARRKFLKSNQVELSNIIKEFEKIALINHDVEFTLSHNDSMIYQLFPGSFKQRITALWGKNLDTQLIPLNVETSLAGIYGFVCKPEFARKRGSLQYLFVNGRFMRHPYFHKAVLTSYQELIPDDAQPNYFLCFNVDPETIDVNIHPTKQEIKFENEMPIWQILAAAIRESLGKFMLVPSIDFDRENAPDIPVFSKNEHYEKPGTGVDKNYNPFKTGKRTENNPAATSLINNWQKLYENFEKGSTQTDVEPDNDGFSIGGKAEDSPQQELFKADVQSTCFQLNNRYIVSPVKSGLMIIDQHRAHTKVLYENYLSQLDGKSVASQNVLFPEVLNLSPANQAIMEQLQPEMEKMGFSLAYLGGNDWSINAVPAGKEKVDYKDTILQVIEAVTQGGKSISEHVLQTIALTVAKSAATPYGKELGSDEMETLLANLLQLPSPNYTPDGKTVIKVITIDQIEKMF